MRDITNCKVKFVDVESDTSLYGLDIKLLFAVIESGGTIDLVYTKAKEFVWYVKCNQTKILTEYVVGKAHDVFFVANKYVTGDDSRIWLPSREFLYLSDVVASPLAPYLGESLN